MDKQKKSVRNISGRYISSTLQEISNFKNSLSN